MHNQQIRNQCLLSGGLPYEQITNLMKRIPDFDISFIETYLSVSPPREDK